MSAKIYEFPAPGRLAAMENFREAANFSAPRAAMISFGAWYHDEAVQAERGQQDEKPKPGKGGSVIPFRPN